MLIKAGVDISRLKGPARRALQIVSDELERREFELVVTSTFEGNHKARSLHYAHLAFDFRQPKGERGGLLTALIKGLGVDYDVIPEMDHMHIEYDPKGS